MNKKQTALVTGANKGIGLQIAKELAGRGFSVLAGSRKFESGEAAAKSIGADAHTIELDVTDQGSISAAAERIQNEFGRLDVLMNNAGISHAGHPGINFKNVGELNSLATAPLEDVRTVFETNVFGVRLEAYATFAIASSLPVHVRASGFRRAFPAHEPRHIAVTQAMLPLLREAPAGRIVITASSGGSLTLNSNHANPHRRMFGNYSVSKTAAHAVMLAFVISLESTNIKVNAACPGFTSTALNNFNGKRSVEEGAREPVRLALIGADGRADTFSDEDGPVAW